MIPHTEVIEAGGFYRKDYLVGFFLDSNHPYHIIKDRCNRVWNPRGGLSVHFDNEIFYFKFLGSYERQCVLDADLILIEGKPFIITTWSPPVDKAHS